MPSTLENRVLNILSECPDTRFDDMLLSLEYYKRYSRYPVEDMPFSMVMSSYKTIGLPNFETIRRMRQRIQNLFPAVARTSEYSIETTVKVELDIAEETGQKSR